MVIPASASSRIPYRLFHFLLPLALSASGLPVPSKRIWKIGIGRRYMTDYIPTFQTYLNEVVGPRFNPNITFELLGFTTVQDHISEVDFAFVHPYNLACIVADSSWSPIATNCKSLGGQLCTTELGATIFTRKDNVEINSLYDLREKKIAIYKTVYFQSLQVPLREMLRNRHVLFADSAQVVAKTSSRNAYLEVMAGDLDAAVLSSGKLESLAQSGVANLSEVKILNSRNTTSAGDPFPFALSTETYPERTLLYSGDVEGADVAAEVLKALFAMNATHPAAIAGGYASWLPAATSSTVTRCLEDIGMIHTDPYTKRRQCTADLGGSNYDGIRCPKGYFKHLRHIVEGQCSAAQLACPPGRECFCKPCKKARRVEVEIGDAQCSKMQVCHNTTQRNAVEVTVRDNAFSGLPLTFTYRTRSTLLLPSSELTMHVGSNFTYVFEVSSSDIGLNTLQIFVGASEIEISPILIRVDARECGEDEMADVEGNCVQTISIEYYVSWGTWCILGSFLVNVIVIGLCAIWTVAYKDTKIVHAAQVPFLLLICLGCLTSSVTLLLLQFDDNPERTFTASTAWLDVSCTGSVWFYALGFCLTASAIRAKLLRAKRLTIDIAEKGKLPTPTIREFVWVVLRTLGAEVLLLVIWTIVDPPRWQRKCIEEHEGFCTSVASCSGESISIGFLLCLFMLHVGYLVHLLYISYQVRFVPQEFAEHKWVTAASISSLEVHILTPLVVALAWNRMGIRVLVLSLGLFFNDLSIMLMVFLPKMRRLHWEETNEKTLNVEDTLHHLRRKVRIIDSKANSFAETGSKAFGSTKRVRSPRERKLGRLSEKNKSKCGGSASEDNSRGGFLEHSDNNRRGSRHGQFGVGSSTIMDRNKTSNSSQLANSPLKLVEKRSLVGVYDKRNTTNTSVNSLDTMIKGSFERGHESPSLSYRRQQSASIVSLQKASPFLSRASAENLALSPVLSNRNTSPRNRTAMAPAPAVKCPLVASVGNNNDEAQKPHGSGLKPSTRSLRNPGNHGAELKPAKTFTTKWAAAMD